MGSATEGHFAFLYDLIQAFRERYKLDVSVLFLEYGQKRNSSFQIDLSSNHFVRPSSRRAISSSTKTSRGNVPTHYHEIGLPAPSGLFFTHYQSQLSDTIVVIDYSQWRFSWRKHVSRSFISPHPSAP